MEFKYTTAIKKIRKLKARKKVVQGGTSAGKTFGIIPVLIDKATKTAGLEISIVSESIPHLRRGALKDFLKIMRWTCRFIPHHYNKSLLTYTFSNGSYIEFFSADMEDKLRGARRNILYINEANNVSFEAYHQLAIRTSKEIYLDYNPTNEFWAHTEVLKEPDSELLILTYLDNEALPENVLGEINNAIAKAETSDYWKNWVKVYVDGEVGRLQGVVFEDWQVIDEIPKEARLEGYGLDFGYASSAFAYIAVYTMDGTYYFDEILHGTGMTNQVAARLILEQGVPDMTAYADYAEPKSIREMQIAGLDVEPCDSKQDIRPYAIKKLQGETFYISKRSTNMISEFEKFKWATDKNGNSTGKPEKVNDHCADAIIYFIGTEDKYTGVYNVSRI